MGTDKPIKVYVNVTVAFDKDGRMWLPTFDIGGRRKYVIDKVLDRKPAAAMHAGGPGK